MQNMQMPQFNQITSGEESNNDQTEQNLFEEDSEEGNRCDYMLMTQFQRQAGDSSSEEDEDAALFDDQEESKIDGVTDGNQREILGNH